MSTEGIQSFILSITALFLGIFTSVISLVNPMKEELPLLMKNPTPTSVLIEQTRQLTPQEQATMSANFIKEFEMMISSDSNRMR